MKTYYIHFINKFKLLLVYRWRNNEYNSALGLRLYMSLYQAHWCRINDYNVEVCFKIETTHSSFHQASAQKG